MAQQVHSQQQPRGLRVAPKKKMNKHEEFLKTRRKYTGVIDAKGNPTALREVTNPAHGPEEQAIVPCRNEKTIGSKKSDVDEETVSKTSQQVGEKVKETAKKELVDAMNRRLGMNMSALALKRLRKCIVNAQKSHVEVELLNEAKKLIALVTGNKNGSKGTNSLVKSAAKTADRAKYVAKETEIWESKNEHLVKKANKRRKEMDELMKERRDPKVKEFYKDFQGTAGDPENILPNNSQRVPQGTASAGPGTNLDNLFQRLGNLYSQTQQQQEKQQPSVQCTTAQAQSLKSVNLPRVEKTKSAHSSPTNIPLRAGGETGEYHHESQGHAGKAEGTDESLQLLDAKVKSRISPLKSPEKKQRKRRLVPKTNYSSLLDDLLAISDEGQDVGSPFPMSPLSPCGTSPMPLVVEAEPSSAKRYSPVTYEHKYDSPVSSPSPKKPSPKLRLHSALALAASDRYKNGSDLGLGDSEPEEDESQNDSEDPPAFMLLESCFRQVNKARTQSQKLRYTKTKASKSVSEEERFVVKKQEQYSSTSYETHSKDFYEHSSYFSDVSESSNMKDEALATAIADDFSRQVDKWLIIYPNCSSTEDERSRFASFLDQTYLSSRLDPLAGTNHVRQIRRKIARRIELIERHGTDEETKRQKNKGSPLPGVIAGAVAEEEGAAEKEVEKEWRCKICTKVNVGDGKCVVCGRERTAEAIKTRAFIKAVPKHSVADRKGMAASSAMFVSKDTGAFYAERLRVKADFKSVTGKKDSSGRAQGGKKPPSTWGGRHSESLRSLPTHGKLKVGSAKPIGYF
jgi:hypothetical protein